MSGSPLGGGMVRILTDTTLLDHALVVLHLVDPW